MISTTFDDKMAKLIESKCPNANLKYCFNIHKDLNGRIAITAEMISDTQPELTLSLFFYAKDNETAFNDVFRMFKVWVNYNCRHDKSE